MQASHFNCFLCTIVTITHKVLSIERLTTYQTLILTDQYQIDYFLAIEVVGDWLNKGRYFVHNLPR